MVVANKLHLSIKSFNIFFNRISVFVSNKLKLCIGSVPSKFSK